MPISQSHGRPYLEPPRHDELPEGIIAAPSEAQKPSAGPFTAGPSGTGALAGAVGGSKRKGRTKLSHEIVGASLTPKSARRARVLRRALAAELSATVGGGMCGVGASLLLKTASQKMAAAEEAFEKGDYEAHRKLSESGRMDLLYSREHAAKLAKARDELGGAGATLAARQAEFQRQLAARPQTPEEDEAEAIEAPADSCPTPDQLKEADVS